MFEMINGHLSLSFHWKKNYSIVIPFEPNDFLSKSWLGITLHTGGKYREGLHQKLWIVKSWKEWVCWKENVKNRKEICEIILQKVEMYKKKQNVKNCEKKKQKKWNESNKVKKRFEGGSKSREKSFIW